MTLNLPPLNPLKAFEAAARLNSLTSAAQELNVSQVAVSRQVKVLEDYLGVVLFHRLHRGIGLTPDGQMLFEGITDAFQRIGNASRRVSRRGRHDLLAVQSYTTFSQRWLIPRIGAFYDAHPKIEVRLSSSTAPVDFDLQNLDAAIRSGTGDFPELDSQKIVDIELIPICSPSLMESAKLKFPDDLARVRLLHSTARPDDWSRWLGSRTTAVDATSGIRFENSALAYEGAMLDVGVAIAVKAFVQRSLNMGTVVAPFDDAQGTDESYYLTWPKRSTPSNTLKKFQLWIEAQSK
jgi:LysR family transcriptional regulator, glycine cleavage system transcriptional activator